MYAKKLMGEKMFVKAVKILAKYGAPTMPNQMNMYKSLSITLLHDTDTECLNDLRTMLMKLCKNLSYSNNIDKNSPIIKEFEKLTLVTHLVNLRSMCYQKNLNIICAKISISLLRYCGYIRLDRAFFDAGVACKQQNWLNMAFMFFNKYLDISEAIDEQDASTIDNTDFEGTDIPYPEQVPLPDSNFLNEDKREEIRDWVLQCISMDQKHNQGLSMRDCDYCGNSVYEANLTGPCGKMYEACCVTG